MLELLRIRDLALIADMELEFVPGMNVLTGETGAGKSFILKALNFLLGERLGAEMVRPGREKAQVEALFALPDGDLILRRELAENGRSRLYINDNLSSQESVRELRPSLLLHTSQHGQQRLLQPAFQAGLVDEWMTRPDLLEKRDALRDALRESASRRNALVQRSRELADRRELLEIHLKTIEKVKPEPGEEEDLEARRAALREAMQARKQYERAFATLRGEDGPGLIELAGNLERTLEVLSRTSEDFASDLESVTAFRNTINELERRLRRPPLAQDAGDLEAIESRLYELAQLKRKLHRTLPEILALREEIEENLSFLDVCALDLKRLDKEERQLRAELQTLLTELNAERTRAAALFCTALEKELAGLGFAEQVRVVAEAVPHELVPALQTTPLTDDESPSGREGREGQGGQSASPAGQACPACIEERVRLLWAPNPGQVPQPLDRIASGGELSRFLLAVVSLQAKGVAAGNDTAILIFDEVDAGVGGLTLNRVAERLEELAGHRQMLLITHWPQLASRAARHFQVVKSVHDNETFTTCTRLEGPAKDAELARMAGIEPA